MKTLVAEYLRQCGYVISAGNGVLDPDDVPSSNETADAFVLFQNTAAPLRHSAQKAYTFWANGFRLVRCKERAV